MKKLTKLLLPFIYSTLAMAFHAIQQISDHRPEWTWLPWWVYTDIDWIPGFIPTLDGYHVTKWLAFVMIIQMVSEFIILVSYPVLEEYKSFIRKSTLLLQLIFWLYGGLVFGFFYHFLFMLDKFKDWRLF